MAFILMRSPKRAPPVFRLDGSTEMMAKFFSGKSIKKRRTNSSTKDDFPAPPVPVIPSTGVSQSLILARSSCKASVMISGKFSAALIQRAMVLGVWTLRSTTSALRLSPMGTSHCCTKSLIMP